MIPISNMNKIRISNRLWITILGDKIVFGNALNQQFHHTISFGNKSGYFDLHTKNQRTGEYCTIITWDHENAIYIFPSLIPKIIQSIFKLNEFKTKTNKETEITILDKDFDLTKDFSSLIKKNKLTLNYEDDDFKEFVSNLAFQSDRKKITIQDFEKIDNAIGFLKNDKESYFIMKSQYLDRIYIIDSINLNFDSVMSEILGSEVYNEIIKRIENAVNQ